MMDRKTLGYVEIFISLVLFFMVFYVQIMKVSYELYRFFQEGHYVVEWLITDSFALAAGIILMLMGIRNLKHLK